MTFSDFVAKSVGRDLSPEQQAICEQYADWRRRRRKGGSGLSIIPGGKAESMLDHWWEDYEDG